jgi:hypothetical protein
MPENHKIIKVYDTFQLKDLRLPEVMNANVKPISVLVLAAQDFSLFVNYSDPFFCSVINKANEFGSRR